MPRPPRLRDQSAPDTAQLLRTLWRTLPELWRSSPVLVSLLGLMALLGGLIPAATLLISKWAVDGVSRVAAGEWTPQQAVGALMDREAKAEA